MCSTPDFNDSYAAYIRNLNHSNHFRPPAPNQPSSSQQSEEQSTTLDTTAINKRQRWTKEQTAVLINSWKDYFKIIESAGSYRAWLKIKVAVDNAGPAKSIKQCKDKVRNLKDAYKQAKDNNKRSGAALQTSTFFEEFDEVLGTRDGVNLNVTQIGVEEEILDSDVESVITNVSANSLTSPGKIRKLSYV